jgi:hypothetical protein
VVDRLPGSWAQLGELPYPPRSSHLIGSPLFHGVRMIVPDLRGIVMSINRRRDRQTDQTINDQRINDQRINGSTINGSTDQRING